MVVDAHHKDRSVVLGGGTHHHPLGTGLDVGAGGFIGEEKAGALEHVIHTNGAPVEVGRIPFGADADAVSIHHQLTVLHPHIPAEAPVGGVVAKHVADVINVDQIVDAHHLHIAQGAGAAEGQAADATEPVNPDANGHGDWRIGGQNTGCPADGG